MPETAIAYGDSGCGKTTICVHLSKWMYETFGLTTRLISAEGWGPVENEGLIKAGVVEAYSLKTAKKFLSATRKLSRGWWPKIVREDVDITDENGVVIGTENKLVRRIVQDNEALSKVGLYFIETADSIADAYMDFIKQEEIIVETDRGTKIQSIGPQGTAGRFEQEGEVLGSNSEGHFGVVQSEMYKLFKDFGGVGGNVKIVFWTAHTGMGKMGSQKSKVTRKDGSSVMKLSGESCYCPLLVGEAKNALVPSWVGDCFHLEDVPLIFDENGEISQQKQVRAYYENHREGGMLEGPQYRAKSRVSPSDIEALHERFPGGFIPLGVKDGSGLDSYYRWLEHRREDNIKSIRGWKEKLDANRSK